MKQDTQVVARSGPGLTGKVFRNKAELIQTSIASSDCVLDVGFSGQGIQHTDTKWPHALLQSRAKAVYGVDLAIDRTAFPDTMRYQEASAESFSFPGIVFESCQTMFERTGDAIDGLRSATVETEADSRHTNIRVD